MKRIFAFFLLLSAAPTVMAVEKKLNKQPKYVEWEANPVTHPVPPEYKNEHAFYLVNDIGYDYRREGKRTVVYYTHHYILKVLDKTGIDDFSTGGFSVGSNTRVPLVRARTILPNGKVKELEKEMIKVTMDGDGRNKIVFALEGVEKNAEIEVLVKEISPYFSFGTTYMQHSVPVAQSHFQLSYPKYLVFEVKGHNGFPSAKDTLTNNRRSITINKANIPALLPEPYAFYNLYRMSAEFRVVSYINENENDKRHLNSWDDFGKMLYDDHYKTLTDKDKTTANRYLTSLGVKIGGNELENIRLIENGIKNGIIVNEELDHKGYNVLDTIVNKKMATSDGVLKLFTACFMQAGINFQLGKTHDRQQSKFYADFENWRNMEYYLFYFPDAKKFISPLNIYCRYPVVTHQATGSKGVFCSIPLNGIATGRLGEVVSIPQLSIGQTRRDMTANVTFDKNMEPTVDAMYSISGFAATDLRKQLLLMPQDKLKDLVHTIVQVADKVDDISKYSCNNPPLDNSNQNKPIEIAATISAPQLLASAGNKYILHIGAVIGQQPELYTEERRVLPVDFAYPVSYTRNITVAIPKGYKIANPEALRIHADYVDKDMQPVVGFKSDYKVVTNKKDGDKLVVTVLEFYKQVHFATTEYERFRKVINAAADFNKVALILVKK